MRKILLSLAFLSAIWVGQIASSVALAQDKPFMAGGPTVTLAVTGTTARVQVQATSASPALRVYNAGTVAVFLNCGDAAVTATVAAGMPVAPGAVEVVGSGQTYCAGISGGTAATLYVTPGDGL
jgi:hypothetical protein